MLFYSLSGYCHPLVFKDLTDEKIATVEQFMRQQGLNHAAIKLSESYNSSCDPLLEYGQLVHIFGTKFAHCPEKFEFVPGEIDCIKKIATHVKKLVDDGTGVKLFKEKRKKQMTAQVFTSSRQTVHTQSHSVLFKELYDCATNCLRSYNVDLAAWSEKCVEIDATGASGSIHCCLCNDDETGIRPKPKRVCYFSSEKRSSYWVISNFKKHLEKVHLLKASRPNKASLKTSTRKSVRKPKVEQNKEQFSIQVSSTATKIESTDLDSLLDTKFEDNNSSIEFLGFEDAHLSMKLSDDSELPLNSQISNQINEMVAAVLINSEKQEAMEFHLKNHPAKFLSIVKTVPDGNCLFSALAHQLWKNKIVHENCKQSKDAHKKMIKDLRSAVVAHILQPENFPSYEYALQERVKELKNKKDAGNSSDRCKLFVRDVLSREGIFGGLETINAVSMMHQVNILVVNECGTCYLIKGSAEKYDRTLLIAYRLMYDDAGDAIYNHYDSVTDMRSEDIFTVADFVINRFKCN